MGRVSDAEIEKSQACAGEAYSTIQVGKKPFSCGLRFLVVSYERNRGSEACMTQVMTIAGWGFPDVVQRELDRVFAFLRKPIV